MQSHVREAELLEHFFEYFCRSAIFGWEALCDCTFESEEKEFARWVSGRVHPVENELDWPDVLLPSEGCRIGFYEKLMQRNVDLAKVLPGANAAMDIGQDPTQRPRLRHGSDAGTNLFALLGGSTVWNHLEQRPMMLEEQLRTHMIPTPAHPDIESLPVPCDFVALVDQGLLKPSHIVDGVGNGWHVGIMGSWIMLLLGSLDFGPEAVERPLIAIDSCLSTPTKVPPKR